MLVKPLLCLTSRYPGDGFPSDCVLAVENSWMFFGRVCTLPGKHRGNTVR